MGNIYSIKTHTDSLVTAIVDQLKVCAGEIHTATATLLRIVVIGFYPDLNRVCLGSHRKDFDAEQIVAG
ncbi:MAG TPA: hypothetical protein ENH65_15480 [Candidatus Aminicenantes bacterium]|nr:hypothetical protein [Candidatus Aminicenantes bacterium]